jgi:hypothetical protein
VEEVKLGVGYHIPPIFLDPVLAANLSRVVKWLWIHSLFNLVAIFFVKISVGLFLVRLVQGKGYKVRIFLWLLHTEMLIKYSVSLYQ